MAVAVGVSEAMTEAEAVAKVVAEAKAMYVGVAVYVAVAEATWLHSPLLSSHGHLSHIFLSILSTFLQGQHSLDLESILRAD